MALNDTTADALAEDAITQYLDTFDPPLTADQRTKTADGMRPIFRSLARAFYARLKTDAVVSPAGTPTAMNVSGTGVSGTGKLT